MLTVKWRLLKLAPKADGEEADVQLEYCKQIEELNTIRESANRKIIELKETDDDAWEDLKTGMDNMWHSLSNAVKSASAKFKSRDQK